MPSLADKIRENIKENLDVDKEFYSNPKNKSDDLSKIFNMAKEGKSKDDIPKRSTVRSNYNRILEQELKLRGIDPNKVLQKRTNIPKFNKELNAKIEPAPQSGNLSNEQKPNTPKIIPQTTIQPNTNVLMPQTFDEEAVSAVFSGLYISLRLAYPELESLTPDEKKSLGKLWVSAFNKYLTDDKMQIIVPLMATFGMFTPKIADARKKRKESKMKVEVQDSPKRARNNLGAEPSKDSTKEESPEKEELEYGLLENNQPQWGGIKPLKQLSKKELEKYKKEHAD